MKHDNHVSPDVRKALQKVYGNRIKSLSPTGETTGNTAEAKVELRSVAGCEMSSLSREGYKISSVFPVSDTSVSAYIREK